jgi:hypothetical protein
MHIYIYDTYVSQKKNNSTIIKIETRITDLGLNGKIVRLSMLGSLFEVIQNEIKKGAKTITVLGDNNILHQAINALAKLKTQGISQKIMPLGFIPVGKVNNSIAFNLGLSLEESACDILSARRIKTFDLGKANDNYFLTEATINSKGTSVNIDQNYSIEIMGVGEIGVVNLPLLRDLPKEAGSNAQDGILELFIKTKENNKLLAFPNKNINQSIFSFKELTIKNKTKKVLLDKTFEITAPVKISIAQEKIDLIVGKSLKF